MSKSDMIKFLALLGLMLVGLGLVVTVWML